jgi:uncharacterized DUF497 family protein
LTIRRHYFFRQIKEVEQQKCKDAKAEEEEERYCFLGQIRRRRSLRRYCFSILDYVAPIMLFRKAGKEENKIRTRFLANLLSQ